MKLAKFLIDSFGVFLFVAGATLMKIGANFVILQPTKDKIIESLKKISEDSKTLDAFMRAVKNKEEKK